MRLDVSFVGLLAAGTMTVSAMTIRLPLKSLAADQDGRAPRGVTSYRQRAPHTHTHTKGVTVPVTDWINRTDNQWYTTFGVGTPPQNFTALLDTGSPSFIVGGSNCTTCGTKRLFDPDRSSTYLASPGTFEDYLFATGADSIPFSALEGATGYDVRDTIAWGGDLRVANQSFVLCDTMAEALNAMPIDGIMGMAPRGRGDPSWFWSLVDDGQLDSGNYSFYLPAGEVEGGEVTLGGYDEDRFEGDLAWTGCDAAATALLGAYVLEQTAVYADGRLLDNGTTSLSSSSSSSETATAAMPAGWALLDTGTAFMQTPDRQTAANLYAQISPAIVPIDPAGAWGAPCGELAAAAPELTFTFGRAGAALNVTIPRASFSLGEYPGQPGVCQALFNHPSEGIDGSWFSGKHGEWLVGSPLLKHYYTVWDGEAKQIGWGRLAGGPGF